MQQGHDYRRFGYQPLNRIGDISAPRGSSSSFDPDNEQGFFSRLMQGDMVQKLRSPLVSTFAILGFAAVFSYVIYSSYPATPDEQQIPVIKAEAMPIRIEPEQADSSDILFKESTVFDSVRTAESQAPKVENLLATEQPEVASVQDVTEEKPLDKQQMLAQQAAEEQKAAEALKLAEAEAEKQKLAAEPKLSELEAPAEDSSDAADISEDVVASEASEAEPAEEIAEVDSIEPASNDIAIKKPEVPVMHKAGASPETLAFVRSVLDKKDEAKAAKSLLPTASAVKKADEKIVIAAAPVAAVVADTPEEPIAKIEPASGAAAKIEAPAPSSIQPAAVPPSAPISSGSGSHYVQLASITSRSAADAEWKKLQSAFSAQLSASSFRVQEANLGEKGTYFRIQAGPYTEAQAKSVCESIKAQKPGGCLIVR